MTEISNPKEMNTLIWLRAEQRRVFGLLISEAMGSSLRQLRPALLATTSARAIAADFIARRRLAQASRR